MSFTSSIVESVAYNAITGYLELTLKGKDYIYFVKPRDIFAGGKHCEVSLLTIGSEIRHNADICPKTRILSDVIIIGDGIKKVDEENNLISW